MTPDSQASERRFEQVFEHSPTAMLMVDRNGSIEMANIAVAQLFGYERAELIGQSVEILVPECFRAPHRGHRASFSAQPRWRPMGAGREFYALRNDGSQFPVEIGLNSIESEDGVAVVATILDISARRQAEQMWRQCAAIVESSDDAIVSKSMEGIITSWNPAAERMFGYSAAEAIGKPITKLIPPDRLDEEADLLGRIARGEHITRYETVRLRKDGSAVDVSVTLSPIMDGFGHIVGASKMAHDITRRKRNEQALSQYAEIVESSNDAIIGETLDGMVTSWNRGAERIFGYSREETLGQPILLLAPEQFADEEKMLLERVRGGILVKHHETVRRCKDGQPIDVSVSISPIRDQSGRIVGAARIVRKLEEESLRENQNLLNAIVKLMPVGLWVFDSQGNIRFFNEAAKQIWLGAHLTTVDQLDEYKGWWHNTGIRIGAHEWAGSRALEKGETSIELEVDIECFDGTRKTILDSAVPLRRSDGSIRGAVTINQDITRRKKIEKDLRERTAILRAFADWAPTAVAMFDREMRYLVATRQWCDERGLGDRDIAGLSHYELFPDFPEHHKEVHRRCLAGAIERSEEEYFVHLDGRGMWMRWEVRPWRYPDGELGGLLIWTQDITASKAINDEIRKMAFNDSLTNLPNRRLLMDRLKHALVASKRSGKEGAVLLVDLDDFKQVNDSLGHDAGDSLLQQVASRLLASVREGDTVSRMGGDEFVVVLENLHENAETAMAQAMQIGKTILGKLNQPYVLVSHDYRGTVSVGAALFGKQEQSAEEVLKRADLALYTAKAEGRNTLRFAGA